MSHIITREEHVVPLVQEVELGLIHDKWWSHVPYIKSEVLQVLDSYRLKQLMILHYRVVQTILVLLAFEVKVD